MSEKTISRYCPFKPVGTATDCCDCTDCIPTIYAIHKTIREKRISILLTGIQQLSADLQINIQRTTCDLSPSWNRIVVPACQATQPGGIGSSKSILGLNKSLKIRAASFRFYGRAKGVVRYRKEVGIYKTARTRQFVH
jgi:hypothetical protein